MLFYNFRKSNNLVLCSNIFFKTLLFITPFKISSQDLPHSNPKRRKLDAQFSMSDFENDSGMDMDDWSAEESAENLFDDNDNGQGDDFGFTQVVSDKNKKKDYEVEYNVLDPKDLSSLQDKLSEQMKNLLEVPKPTALCLLREFKWKQEKLIERYMEDPDTVMKKAGLTLDNGYIYFFSYSNFSSISY